jgi:hypothetical protein
MPMLIPDEFQSVAAAQQDEAACVARQVGRTLLAGWLCMTPFACGCGARPAATI